MLRQHHSKSNKKYSKNRSGKRRGWVKECYGTPTDTHGQERLTNEQTAFEQRIIVPSFEPVPTTGEKLTVSFGQATIPNLNQLEDDLGFFIDSAPSGSMGPSSYQMPVYNAPASGTPANISKPSTKTDRYKKQKKKIIQDEDVYISEDSEDEIDRRSVSSSEDIDLLKSLSHWGANDSQHFTNDYLENQEPGELTLPEPDDEADKIALLFLVQFEDVCADPLKMNEKDMDMSVDIDIDSVPKHLRNAYFGLMDQEKRNLKKERNIMYRQRMKSNTTANLYRNKILTLIFAGLLREPKQESIQLFHTTKYGREKVLPSIAEVFFLELDISKNTVTLTKTSKTAARFERYMLEKRKKKPNLDYIKLESAEVNSKKMKSPKDHVLRRKLNEAHGKVMPGEVVGSNALPIASSNIGHRMLTAMGWKEGDSIGNDGIKEPIIAIKRAKRSGLGA
ncbi:unnamed protein product [Rhizopus stolonifer]